MVVDICPITGSAVVVVLGCKAPTLTPPEPPVLAGGVELCVQPEIQPSPQYAAVFPHQPYLYSNVSAGRLAKGSSRTVSSIHRYRRCCLGHKLYPHWPDHTCRQSRKLVFVSLEYLEALKGVIGQWVRICTMVRRSSVGRICDAHSLCELQS
jgi:hypothetical protein